MTSSAPLLRPLESRTVDVLWLAGEHSGDQHAALVAKDLAERHPELRQAAVGGPALAAARIDVLHDLTENSVVGLVEVLRHYGYFKALFAETLEWIRTHQVRVLVLVDYPGFNLRLAKALHEAGLTRKSGGPLAIYYYISPQIWAWKGKRRFEMAQLLDELGVIFPFEIESFADTELDVRFVGHPFLAEGHAPPVHYDPAGDLLLLAGSRLQPVRRILPSLLEGVREARRKGILAEDVSVSTLVPNEALASVVRSTAEEKGVELTIYHTGTPVGARAVLTSSGTMSLACALAGIPGAIVYRAHPVTYWIGRSLVKIPYLGIANLILQRPMYPEFIQGQASPSRLAGALAEALSPQGVARTKQDQAELREALSPPGEATAAERIAQLLGS
jgi:lipid-A-disaccharide synthase